METNIEGSPGGEGGIKNFGPLRKVEPYPGYQPGGYPSGHKLSPARHISTRERYNVEIYNA